MPSILVELDLYRFIDSWGTILINNVGIVYATPRLIGPEYHMRRIVRHIHESAGQDEEEIWRGCVEIWPPVEEFSRLIARLIREGPPQSVLAIALS